MTDSERSVKSAPSRPGRKMTGRKTTISVSIDPRRGGRQLQGVSQDAVSGSPSSKVSFLEVFQDHDVVVDDHPDGEGKAPEGHDVDRPPENLERQQRHGGYLQWVKRAWGERLRSSYHEGRR